MPINPVPPKPCIGFHSISFPSEWGGERHLLLDSDNLWCFHSISFPSEWGVQQKVLKASLTCTISCFHSISFPSEWGVLIFSALAGWVVQGLFTKDHSIDIHTATSTPLQTAETLTPQQSRDRTRAWASQPFVLSLAASNYD